MRFVFKANVLRVSLIAANFIFSILSVALIALGVVYFKELSLLKLYIIDDSFKQLPILLIVLGILSFLAAISGCYFVKHHSERFLKLFIAFLTFLLAMELSISCIAFLNLDYETVNNTVKVMVEQLKNDTLREDFSKIEEHYECCGIFGLQDYLIFTVSNNSICREYVEQSGWQADGCAPIVFKNIERICLEIGCVAAVYSCLQVIDITCLLLIFFTE